MTFEEFAKSVSDTKGLSRKRVYGLAIKLLVLILLLTLIIGYAVSSLFHPLLSVGVLILSIVGYLSLLRFMSDDDKCFNFVSKVVKYFYFLVILEILLLLGVMYLLGVFKF